MGSTLNDSDKAILRGKIITGAKKYKNKLIGKVFGIYCEDEKLYELRFFGKDFKHLTGIQNAMDAIKFFERACTGTLTTGNIKTSQKYSRNTLMDKASRIEEIDKIVYENADKSLFLVDLHTNTADFPYAIKNDTMNACIGFVSATNNARTLRTSSKNLDYKDEKKIIAIFARSDQFSKYSEQTYLSDKSLVAKNIELLKLLDDGLKQNFIDEMVSESPAADEVAATKIE